MIEFIRNTTDGKYYIIDDMCEKIKLIDRIEKADTPTYLVKFDVYGKINKNNIEYDLGELINNTRINHRDRRDLLYVLIMDKSVAYLIFPNEDKLDNIMNEFNIEIEEIISVEEYIIKGIIE